MTIDLAQVQGYGANNHVVVRNNALANGGTLTIVNLAANNRHRVNYFWFATNTNGLFEVQFAGVTQFYIYNGISGTYGLSFPGNGWESEGNGAWRILNSSGGVADVCVSLGYSEHSGIV